MPDCLSIVRHRIENISEDRRWRPTESTWWQFERIRKELYSTIADFDKVLVVCQTGKFHSYVFVPTGMVYSTKVVVFALREPSDFAVLQSTLHREWVLQYGASLKLDPVYTPSDCFESFPFPAKTSRCDSVGERYHTCRHSVALTRRQGLTETYNLFHQSTETSEEIRQLRDLHVEMDNAVASAYGWSDLDLGHGFYETKQGTRFTISESARREVLARLLKLNHERYAEEVAQGLHNKKGKPKGAGRKGKKASSGDEAMLF